MNRWPIARYLFGSHTVFLLMVVAGFYLLGGSLIVAVASLFTPITISIVDAAAQVLPWAALGYGSSAAGLLTVVLVHGRTRREFLLQHPVFQLTTTGLLAALITGCYALEAGAYRLAGWEQGLQDQRIYSAGDYPLIFLAYWCMLSVWLMAGAFVGAALYHWEAAGALALLPAAALVLVTGGVNGFVSLPFARIGLDGVPALLAVTILATAAGWALLWVSVRDVALRTKVPA